MLVFDLPSSPTCSRSSRTTTRRRRTPRASRSRASTCWSSSTTAWAAWPTRWSTATWPSARERFDDELIAEIEKFAPSQLEISDRDGDGQTEVIIKHVYIERRMIPLNIYLQEAFDAAGHPNAPRASRSSAPWSSTATPSRTWWPPTSSPATCCGRTSASPATARWCSTTTTRSSTSPTATSAACPPPRNEEDEMSGEVWYSVGPKRRVPRDLRPFLLGNPPCARSSCAPRRPAGRGLLAGHKERIQAGHVHDVFPYEREALHVGAAQGARQRLPADAYRAIRRPHLRSNEPLDNPTSEQTALVIHLVHRSGEQLGRHMFCRSDPIVIVVRRPHPHGRLPGRLRRAGRARPGRRCHPAAVERAGVRPSRRRSAVRQLPDGRPGPGAGAPGGASRAACPRAPAPSRCPRCAARACAA
jgi:hypothetical protein